MPEYFFHERFEIQIYRYWRVYWCRKNYAGPIIIKRFSYTPYSGAVWGKFFSPQILPGSSSICLPSGIKFPCRPFSATQDPGNLTSIYFTPTLLLITTFRNLSFFARKTLQEDEFSLFMRLYQIKWLPSYLSLICMFICICRWTDYWKISKNRGRS